MADILMGPVVNHEAVRMLEEALASVKRGDVSTVAVIAGTSCGASGPDLAWLYVNCDVLKQRILAALSQKPSPILRRPGGRMAV